MKVWYVVNGACRIVSISRHNVIGVVFLLHILMTWSHQWSIWLSLGSPRRFSVSMFTSKECTICNFLFADDWALMSQMRFTFQDQALVSMVAAYFGFFRLRHGEDGWSFWQFWESNMLDVWTIFRKDIQIELGKSWGIILLSLEQSTYLPMNGWEDILVKGELGKVSVWLVLRCGENA